MNNVFGAKCLVVVSLSLSYATSIALAAQTQDAKSQTSAHMNEKEKAFKALLTESVLEGIFQLTGKGGLKGNDPLSEPKKERYEIASIDKTVGNDWVVHARVQYGKTDVTVPIPVRVVWAEDTPMITLDSIPIPMMGTYSARVIFHQRFYSGVWYSKAGNYGGILTGRVFKKSDKKDDAAGSEK